MARIYFDGYPASLGGKVECIGAMTGPTSYATVPGQAFDGQIFNDSAARSIDWVDGSVTVSGTYRVHGQPSTAGHTKTWYFRWIVIASGVEVTAGTNLSGETFVFKATYS
jgi:hypothetical protein